MTEISRRGIVSDCVGILKVLGMWKGGFLEFFLKAS